MSILYHRCRSGRRVFRRRGPASSRRGEFLAWISSTWDGVSIVTVHQAILPVSRSIPMRSPPSVLPSVDAVVDQIWFPSITGEEWPRPSISVFQRMWRSGFHFVAGTATSPAFPCPVSPRNCGHWAGVRRKPAKGGGQGNARDALPPVCRPPSFGTPIHGLSWPLVGTVTSRRGGPEDLFG